MKKQSGFTELKYKGKSVVLETPNIDTYTAYFNHIYRTNNFISPKFRKHACLWGGVWCWKDAWEHPRAIIPFLRMKIGIPIKPKKPLLGKNEIMFVNEDNFKVK